MRVKYLLAMACCMAVSLPASSAFAKGDEENLSKLGVFKRTDTGPMQRVPQEGKYADNLR